MEIIMTNFSIAKKWREDNQEMNMDYLNAGYVVLYSRKAVGWIRVLENPQGWCPNAIAIDVNGNEYLASGGNDYDGAREWILNNSQRFNLF